MFHDLDNRCLFVLDLRFGRSADLFPIAHQRPFSGLAEHEDFRTIERDWFDLQHIKHVADLECDPVAKSTKFKRAVPDVGVGSWSDAVTLCQKRDQVAWGDKTCGEFISRSNSLLSSPMPAFRSTWPAIAQGRLDFVRGGCLQSVPELIIWQLTQPRSHARVIEAPVADEPPAQLIMRKLRFVERDI